MENKEKQRTRFYIEVDHDPMTEAELNELDELFASAAIGLIPSLKGVTYWHEEYRADLFDADVPKLSLTEQDIFVFAEILKQIVRGEKPDYKKKRTEEMLNGSVDRDITIGHVGYGEPRP